MFASVDIPQLMLQAPSQLNPCFLEPGELDQRHQLKTNAKQAICDPLQLNDYFKNKVVSYAA